MTYQHLLVKQEEAITTITLNRPEKRNALGAGRDGGADGGRREVGDSDALGVILAANGPVFSAGHNFGDMRGATLADARRLFQICTDMMDAVQAHPSAGGGQGARAGHRGGMPARGVVRPRRGRRRRPASPSPAARAGCSATRRWWPWPATSVASVRWRWPSPVTRSTPARPPTGAWSTGWCRPTELDEATWDLITRATRGSIESRRASASRASTPRSAVTSTTAYAFADRADVVRRHDPRRAGGLRRLPREAQAPVQAPPERPTSSDAGRRLARRSPAPAVGSPSMKLSMSIELRRRVQGVGRRRSSSSRRPGSTWCGSPRRTASTPSARWATWRPGPSGSRSAPASSTCTPARPALMAMTAAGLRLRQRRPLRPRPRRFRTAGGRRASTASRTRSR